MTAPGATVTVLAHAGRSAEVPGTGELAPSRSGRHLGEGASRDQGRLRRSADVKGESRVRVGSGQREVEGGRGAGKGHGTAPGRG